MSVVATHLAASVAGLDQAERRQVQERKRDRDRAQEARGRRDERDVVVAIELPEAIDPVDREGHGHQTPASRRGDERGEQDRLAVYTPKGVQVTRDGAALDVRG